MRNGHDAIILIPLRQRCTIDFKDIASVENSLANSAFFLFLGNTHRFTWPKQQVKHTIGKTSAA
jgi:hypothetical protein